MSLLLSAYTPLQYLMLLGTGQESRGSLEFTSLGADLTTALRPSTFAVFQVEGNLLASRMRTSTFSMSASLLHYLTGGQEMSERHALATFEFRPRTSTTLAYGLSQRRVRFDSATSGSPAAIKTLSFLCPQLALGFETLINRRLNVGSRLQLASSFVSEQGYSALAGALHLRLVFKL